MEDPNLIAILYATPYAPRGPTGEHIASPRYLDPRELKLPPCIMLRFNDPPRRRGGYKLGASDDICDIPVPEPAAARGLMPYQCTIGFNRHLQLVLTDLRGTEEKIEDFGITVTYDGKGDQSRYGRGFTWILAGADFADNADCIAIHVQPYLGFRVAVPKTWRENLGRFLSRRGPWRGQTITSIDSTNFFVDTESHQVVPSHLMAANEGRIWLDYGNIGQGTSSVVTAVADVSTGRIFARKTICGNVEGEIFAREVGILRRMRHDHIIQLIESDNHPQAMYLEFMGGGDLRTSHQNVAISRAEGLAILRQLLEGLAYLQLENVVHGDIQPANILIDYRDSGLNPPIKIKLADFGLSSSTGQSILRSKVTEYSAPEIHGLPRPGLDCPESQPYDHKADIWSAGVTVLELAVGLPERSGVYRGLQWCGALVARLWEHRTDELAGFLIQHMVVDYPEKRLSAEECLIQAGARSR